MLESIDLRQLWDIVKSNQEHITKFNGEMGAVQAEVKFIARMMWIAVGLGASTLFASLFNTKIVHKIKNGK